MKMACVHSIEKATRAEFDNDIVVLAVVGVGVAAVRSVVVADSNRFDKHRMCDRCYCYSTMVIWALEHGRSVHVYAYWQNFVGPTQLARIDLCYEVLSKWAQK